MSRLRLKRTPLEVERLRCKIKKAERKASREEARRSMALDADSDEDGEMPRRKRKHAQDVYDDPHSPPSPTSSELPSTSTSAEMDENGFRERLWDALGDDERLDSIDARFRSYHIPNRWRGECDGHLAQDPQYMDDDEYAEWVRKGMWRYVVGSSSSS